MFLRKRMYNSTRSRRRHKRCNITSNRSVPNEIIRRKVKYIASVIRRSRRCSNRPSRRICNRSALLRESKRSVIRSPLYYNSEISSKNEEMMHNINYPQLFRDMRISILPQLAIRHNTRRNRRHLPTKMMRINRRPAPLLVDMIP